MKNPRSSGVLALLPLAAVAASVSLLPAGPARATELTILPGGTAMTMGIDSPATGVTLPPGVVQIRGQAEIARVGPVRDTTVVFILDTSDSMNFETGMDCNGDGDLDQGFECARAAVRAANRAAASTSATVAFTGLGAFSGCAGFPYWAAYADLTPPPPFQPYRLVAPPGTDGDGDGIADLEEGLASIESGSFFTCLGRAVNTAGIILQSPYNTSSKHVVVLISDGFESDSELGGIAYFYPPNTIVRAFAVPGGTCRSPAGEGSPILYSLAEIAGTTGTCVEVERWRDLESTVTQAVAPMMLDLDVVIDGQRADVLAVQPRLPRVAPAHVEFTAFHILTPGDHEICATAKGRDLAGEGNVRDCMQVTVKDTTRLTYDGATSGSHHAAFGLSAILARQTGSAGVPGKTVAFTLGTQGCTSVTDAAGRAVCTVILDQGPGNYSVVATFEGDALYGASNASTPFVITRSPAAITYTGPVLIPDGRLAALSADVREHDVGGLGLAGRSVTLTLGSGPTAQVCSGTTDASGRVQCGIDRVNQALGPSVVSAAFAGDASYLPASTTVDALVFAYVAEGSFVVGDLSAAQVGLLNFWGARWSDNNALSSGPAPSAFKGFATDAVVQPACGLGWESRPGNSSEPPTRVPGYMAVIVTSDVDKSTSTISGDTLRVVILKTNPGYAPNPGHDGYGTSVATLCDLRPRAPLSITTSTLAPAPPDQPYAQTLLASGGSPPYAWSVSEGALPPGIVLDTATGLVAGTPTQAGRFAFTAQVKDAEWTTVRKRVSIAVANASGFRTLLPCRVIDTRGGAPVPGEALVAGSTRSFGFAGVCGIPSTAKAVSVNLTVTESTEAGDLRVFPAGAELPLVSSINYAAGQTRANNAVVALGAGGAVTVHCDQAAGSVHFVVDVNGYFQ